MFVTLHLTLVNNTVISLLPSSNQFGTGLSSNGFLKVENTSYTLILSMAKSVLKEGLTNCPGLKDFHFLGVGTSMP